MKTVVFGVRSPLVVTFVTLNIGEKIKSATATFGSKQNWKTTGINHKIDVEYTNKFVQILSYLKHITCQQMSFHWQH